MKTAANMARPLAIIVVGASGDLARKKILPALFSLYCQGFLPERFHILGFSRTAFTHDGFRQKVTEHLTCRYVPGSHCAEKMEAFLSRCFYQQGDYGSVDSMLNLYGLLRQVEGNELANRVFYLAIPPQVFLDVARSVGDSGLAACDGSEPWARVVIEKPFGRDRASSDQLTRGLVNVFHEEQVYRIDHYLGKEMIQNLLVLRFANLVFQPVWNREYIKNVHIAWEENLTTEGRGGYFDGFGIIRDVMQNHLLQMLALTAMESPKTLDAKHVQDEKVRLLRAMPPVSMQDSVLGQYGPGMLGNRQMPGYLDDATVPRGSRTPTFAAVALRIENARWQGVPFLLTAGKGLGRRMTEIRIRFHKVPANIFCRQGECPQPNQLTIRVQPEEAIYLDVVNKVPGLDITFEPRALDLKYHEEFHQTIPDAYERLLLDVVAGDRSLFIRYDELAAAWDIFTPLLHEIEKKAIVPESYIFGSSGPAGAGVLARKQDMVWETVG